MQRLGSQSAMEFLMTYGYVFLIIAVVLAVLVAFFSIPKTTIPFSCNFYSGFTCTDAVLWNFGLLGNQHVSFVIAALDTMPGEVSIMGFNAFINYQKNNGGGYCVPNNNVLEGQYIYCVANFTFYASAQNIYQGTFNLTASYCTPASQNLSNVECSASKNVVFGGAVRVQTTNATNGQNTLMDLIKLNPKLMYYVPITITNNQPVSTPAPFQQLLQIPSSTYAAHINSGWSNVEFSTLPAGRGAIMEAWVENNPTNSGNTYVWVSLPGGIAANSSETIYADFLSYNVLSAYGPTGEAPQLSTSYGKYDNGAIMFPFYENFSGSSQYLPSDIWNTLAPSFYTISNGIQLSGTGSGTLYAESYATYSVPLAIDMYRTISGGKWYGFDFPNIYTDNGVRFYDYSGWNTYNNVVTLSGGSESKNTWYVQTGMITSTGQAIEAINYANVIVSSPGYTSNVKGPIYLESASGKGVIQWMRARAYPPNGVMPMVTYGGTVTLGVGG